VEGGFSARSRSTISIALIVIGGVLLLIGVLGFYARERVIDQETFADQATEALADDDVRRVVSREIVVNLIDQGSTDLIAARPLIESVVDAALDTGAFREFFREAALEANRVLFVRDRDNAAFRISDAYEVVRFGLRSVAPELASEIPPRLGATLLKLKERDFARESLQVADGVRVLGLVLPLLGLVAFAAAVAIAPNRRVAVLRSGVAVGTVGVVLAIAVLILRARILANVFGEDELTDEEVQGAVAGILDAFVGDLFIWALALSMAGLIAAGAAAALDPVRVEDPAARVRRRLLERPETNWGRGLRAAGALALGILVLVDPSLALRVVAVLAGAYLIYFAVTELLLLTQLGVRHTEDEVRERRGWLATAAVAGGLAVVALVVLVLVFTGEDAEPPGGGPVSPAGTCNGSPQLCSLRLDEAVFAGTHNSFSAADSPNWYIANQRRTIDRQLQDGIRLFLIDPHWGVGGENGRVRTDFEAEGRDRNRVAAALPPKTLRAAERLAGSVGLRPGEDGEREIWLCHTVCELGATRMVDALTLMREFLDANPGEVLILFIEPYVPPEEIATAFQEAGLDRYVATLEPDAPLPTLGELVRSGRRVIVFTERDGDGSVPWYLDGFSFVQDTPLGATKPEDLSCALNRGTRDSPMLMLNHWADVFPPSLSANVAFLRKRFILARARRCARRRGLPVSLIAVDHYDQGDLIAAVRKLNRQQVAAVRRAGA
jgi:hypothetical protein